MKILVFSDSHGFTNKIETMLAEESDCKTVFFLGDGLRDLESIIPEHPDIKFITVKGNNDYDFFKDDFAYNHINGVTIMATHGHTLDVRSGLSRLIVKANSVRAHLALYGHTHVRNIYHDSRMGVCAVNPGALCGGNYCVIEINDGKFEVYEKRV